MVCPTSPMVTALGSEDGSIERLKYLVSLNVSSLFMLTSNEAVVIPAGNVTSYGPEK